MSSVNPSAETNVGESGETTDDVDSHEALWAAMPTTIVADSTLHQASQTGIVVQRAPVVEDSDSDSDASSSSTSTSASDGAGWGGSANEVAASTASTAGPAIDAADNDGDGLTLQDLFPEMGGAEHLDTDLPNVADVQHMLAEIAARRQAIQSIASKYTPMLPRATRPPDQNSGVPCEVTSHVPQPNRTESSNGWMTDTRAVAVSSSVAQSPDQVAFTQLDEVAEGGEAESQAFEAKPVVGSKYAVGSSSGYPVDMRSAQADVDVDMNEDEDCKVTIKSVAAPLIRPWTPADGPALGPAAPHDKDSAAVMLDQLGKRFRETDPAAARQRIAETSDIIRELGARFGEMGTFSPHAAARKAAAALENTSNSLKEGDIVILKGLSRSELNGKEAKVERASAKSLVPAPGRYCVRLTEGHDSESSAGRLSIKSCNMEEAFASVPAPSSRAVGDATQTATTIVDEEPSKINSIAIAEKKTQTIESSCTAAKQYKAAWPYSEEKVSSGLQADELKQKEMWHQFLAGDDQPVGSDCLPPPELYYGD